MARVKRAEEPQAYRRASEIEQATRALVADEVADHVAAQLRDLVSEGAVLGGRTEVAAKLRKVLEAEQGGDRAVLRAAVMDMGVACASWIVALDYRPPMLISPRNGRTEVAV